tara:strand:+ start:55771 stop:56532 length:762 start_codon:yes stop_codon:yes gene_type:complete
MTTYAIGDVQGCYDALQTLLDDIHYSDADTLWFVGDLINRGPKSLETLRFIKSLKNAVTVLGNHDLATVAIAHDFAQQHESDTLDDILHAPDRDELLHWLCQQPLIHTQHDYTLVHAGIYPWWSLDEANHYAHEVETVLRTDPLSFIEHLYGSQPDKWSNELTGIDRLRFICNAFTRMRFCHADGRLDFKHKGKLTDAPSDLTPWFNIPNRKTQNNKILFGHWAALRGDIEVKNVYALDTGCIWGGKLTAFAL